ncbi:hypothetical protein BGX28_000564 [Mortierella sp. GBA30]|nr:hypothetical protein BGX28_000564 [Mortierella sp. GBA30]
MAMVSVQASLRAHYRNLSLEGQRKRRQVNDVDYFAKNTQGQIADFPKARSRTGFVCLPEFALLDTFYARGDTKKIIEGMLQELSPEDHVMSKKDQASLESFRFKTPPTDYVRDRIGRLIERLFGTGGHCSVSVQQDPTDTKYKMKGSIVTSDLEGHLLAYDVKCPRPKKNSQCKRQG